MLDEKTKILTDEARTKLLMMSNEERIAFLNHVLNTDGLRFKLIELKDLEKQIKTLKEEVEPYKLALVETMKMANLGEFEITDGLFINMRKGSSFYRISYKDIEKEFPHLLDELEPITKITNVKDTYSTKYVEE